MSPSPLFSLPTELRLHIYTFLFSHPTPITLSISFIHPIARPTNAYHITTRAKTKQTLPQNFLAITETNHQIRQESLSILLETNSWKICNTTPLHAMHPEFTDEFIGAIPPWLNSFGSCWPKHLKAVSVHMGDSKDIQRLNRVKEIFQSCSLQLTIRHHLFEVCFNGRGFGEMIAALAKKADEKEKGLSGNHWKAIRKRENMRTCEKEIKEWLKSLDEDPEWDW